MSLVQPTPSATASLFASVSAARSGSSAAASATGGVYNPVGVLSGHSPAVYNADDPIILFIIQAVIIIFFCRMLHIPLSRIRQPRVIAEIIGGILLGPTAFGRIPHFTATIFPKVSLPLLGLVANLGLVLFLFIVGLEVDLRLIKANWRVACSVGVVSMAIPFGCGAGMAYGLYNTFPVGKPGSFGIYLLFVGTAFSITAFPVLARILSELKILQSNVGTVVLSAGVGNDVVGWILLALTIALVNASTGVTAVYILLLCVAWILVLVFVVRPLYVKLARRTMSFKNGPSDTMVFVTVLLVLVSSFFTNIIGVHAIFGSFLVGLMIPHDNGYAVKLAEKIEDIVSVLFLPLYFASSGLKTNIGLLNDGKAWGWTILIIVVATASKMTGSTFAARLNGFLWRESLTVGVLMSCKGLVELIVLNVGLNAGILTPKVFTMFVIMALVTTFVTTPLTTWLYPSAYQNKVAAWRRGEIDWEGNSLAPGSKHGAANSGFGSILAYGAPLDGESDKMMIVLNRLEGLPGLTHFIRFLSRTEDSDAPLHTLRVLELTDRLSQLIQVSESDDLAASDPLINVFGSFAAMAGISITTKLDIIPDHQFWSAIIDEARDIRAASMIIPWIWDQLDTKGGNEYIGEVCTNAVCPVGIFVERCKVFEKPRLHNRRTLSVSSLRNPKVMSLSENSRKRRSRPEQEFQGDKKQSVFVPLFGCGDDEKACLMFMMKLLDNKNVTATVLHFGHSNTVSSPSPPTFSLGHTSVELDPSANEMGFATAGENDVDATITQKRMSGNIAHVATAKSLDLAREKEFVSEFATTLGTSTSLSERMTLDCITSPHPIRDAIQRLQNETKRGSVLTILPRTIDNIGGKQWLVNEMHVEMARRSTVGLRRICGDLAEVFGAAALGDLLVVSSAKANGMNI